MRTMLLATAAAIMLAAPAAAQVYFRDGPGGFDVRVGHEFSYGERYYDRDWADGSDHCRTISSRMALPNGRVTYRTRRVC